MRITDRRFALSVVLFLAFFGPASARTDLNPRLDIGETSAGNYLAAMIAGAKQDTGAASFYWREALRGDPRNTEIMDRAFVTTLADGNFAESARLAERITQRDKRNSLGLVMLGVRSLKNRQYQQARDQFGRAGPTGPRGRSSDLTASLLSAWALVGLGETTRALETLDRAAKDPALVAYRNFFGGLMADVGGSRAEAERRLRAANDGEPMVLRVADAYARLLARLGKTEDAKKVYARFQANGQRQPLIEKPVADLAAGRIPDPLVTTVPQGAAEVFYGLGTLGGRSGDDIAAIVYLQLASYLDPDNEIVAMTLAELFEQVGQYDRASEAYARVDAASPLRSRAVVRNAVSLDKLDRGDQALSLLQNELKQHPKDSDAADTLAALLRQKKRWADSADAYTSAINEIGAPTRRNWGLFFGRGIANERAKRWPEAEADLKKALSLLPENPTEPQDKRDRAQVLNYLGYSWVDMNLHVDEAFPMLKQAVELSPTDGYIVDSLGWGYFRQSRFEDSVRELERAIELRPGDPTINDHLGDAYWRVGPQARGALPVEPRARPEARAGRAAENPRQDRERSGRTRKIGRAARQRRDPEAQRRLSRPVEDDAPHERARAKVNLTLHVIGRRPDGYHDLESLVAFADVGDLLELRVGLDLGLVVVGPAADATGRLEDNAVLKAARLFAARFPDARTGAFRLDKRLPVAAGIGGGSADAAAALRLLARINDMDEGAPVLFEIARVVGADVPVCLAGQPCMMRGIGERLSPIVMPTLPALLVNPRVPVETPRVFEALGLALGQVARQESEDGDALDHLRAGVNDLQIPAMRVEPVIATLLNALGELPRARLVRMSGSGGTCFALFDDKVDADVAKGILAAAHPQWWIESTRIG